MSSIETELRLYLDPVKSKNKFNLFEDRKQFIGSLVNLVNKISLNATEKPTLEKSINFIKNLENDCMAVKKKVYKDDTITINYLKKRLENPEVIHEKITYQLSIAEEIETKDNNFDIYDTELIRVRLRFSIPLSLPNIEPGWYMEITMVNNWKKSNKELRFNINYIRYLKDNMFQLTDINEFFNFMYDINPDNIEVEFEWKGKENVNDISWVENIIYPILEPKNSLVQSVYIHAAQLLEIDTTPYQTGAYGIKQLIHNVITLNHKILMENIIYKLDEYFIVPKIDGQTAICIIENGNLAIATSTDVYNIELSTDITDIFDGVWVFDAEYEVDNKHLHPHDIRMACNINISNIPFVRRVEYLQCLSFDNELIKVEPLPLYKFKERKQVECKTDGWILTSSQINQISSNRSMYQTSLMYKWKTKEDTTIDFLIKKCPDNMLNVSPYISSDKGKNIYVLCCGIEPSKFISQKKILYGEKNENKNIYKNIYKNVSKIPVLFEPENDPNNHIFWSDDDLDGEVGEFKYDNEWKLVRLRLDRKTEIKRGNYLGNVNYVCSMNWLATEHPISENMFYDCSRMIIVNQLTKNISNIVRLYVGEKKHVPYLLCSSVGSQLRMFSADYILSIVDHPYDINLLLEDRFNITTTFKWHYVSSNWVENMTKKIVKYPQGGFNVILHMFEFNIEEKSITKRVNEYVKYLHKSGKIILFIIDYHREKAEKMISVLNTRKNIRLISDQQHEHIRVMVWDKSKI
jgi:hypothetical protein